MAHPVPAPASSTGLAPNVAGALSYFLGPITGVVFLLLEKENRFVRFHAMQSIVIGVLMIGLSIALSLMAGILAVIPILGWIVAILLSFGLAIASLILWIMLMWRAFQGKEWEFPVAGPLARKQLGA